MPTGGTRLPIVRSGNVGASPFLGQLSGKQRGSTLLGPYTALGSSSIKMSDAGPPRPRLSRSGATLAEKQEATGPRMIGHRVMGHSRACFE